MDKNTMIIGGVIALAFVIVIIAMLMHKKEGYGEVLGIERIPEREMLPLLIIIVKPELNFFFRAKDAFLLADYFQNFIGRAVFMYRIMDKLPGAGNEDDNLQIRTFIPGKEETVKNVKVDLNMRPDQVRGRIHAVHKSVAMCMSKDCNVEHFDVHESKYDFPICSISVKPEIDLLLNAMTAFNMINRTQGQLKSKVLFVYHITDNLSRYCWEECNIAIRIFVDGREEIARGAGINLSQSKEESERDIYLAHESALQKFLMG